MKKSNNGKKKSPWIDGWFDPLAGISCMSRSLGLFDVMNNGSHHVVFGCHFNNAQSSVKGRNVLRSFNGTECVAERVLSDSPICISCFYNHQKKPLVAVGTTSAIFVYEELRPFYKFVLPDIEVSKTENLIWENLKHENLGVLEGFSEISNLSDSKIPLTSRSLEYLGIGKKKEHDLRDFVKSRTRFPLVRKTILTCMTCITKTEHPSSPSQLLVGTEHGKVLIVSADLQNVEKEISLYGVIPVLFDVVGCIGKGYRILVTCRNGYIRIIRNGEVSGMSIQVPSAIVDSRWCNQEIIVGTMDQQIICFDRKGGKVYGIKVDAPISCMDILDLSAYGGKKSIIVALKDKSIKIFQRKHLINEFTTSDVVTGIAFGTYGSEPSTLVLCYHHGGIHIKYISRKGDFSLNSSSPPGPPKEQQIPIKLPKKTTLFMQQNEREIAFATDIHNMFQASLIRLKYRAAKTFHDMLTDGRGSYSEISGSEVSCSVELAGLGPLFVIKLNIKATGSKILMDIPVIFKFDSELYKLEKNMIIIPNLIPHMEYVFENKVRYIFKDAERNDKIFCYVMHKNRTIPLVTAVIQMPLIAIVE